MGLIAEALKDQNGFQWLRFGHSGWKGGYTEGFTKGVKIPVFQAALLTLVAFGGKVDFGSFRCRAGKS